MTLGRNLIVGLANSIWSALIGLAVVPFYLKYLGIEAYGLIGLFITMQAVLSLLDMGMAPTINREVALCSASGDLKEAGKLLHTLAVVYWTTAGAIALLVLVISPLVATYWLQSKQLPAHTIVHAVMLMGLVVACRWPIGLYQGALMGAQRLAVSSGINMIMATMSSLGAVLVLAFVSPSIEAFFIWQAGIGFFYALIMRAAAWRVIGKPDQLNFDLNRLISVWRFSAGMSGVAISSIILMQLDKVLLSKMLNLEDFGRYALAGMVSGGLYIVLTPMFNVIYPRLSVLIAKNENENLISLYRSGTRLLLAALFPMAGVVALYSNEILFLWTRNPAVAASAGPVVSLFLIGTALNGAMHFPYALQLAYGKTSLPLKINAILIIVMIPTTITLSSKYGAVGGAGAWAVLNATYLFVGTKLTHQTLLKGIGVRWLLEDVGIPLFVTLLIIGGLGLKLKELDLSYSVDMLIGVGLALCAFLVNVALNSGLINSVRVAIGQKGT